MSLFYKSLHNWKFSSRGSSRSTHFPYPKKLITSLGTVFQPIANPKTEGKKCKTGNKDGLKSALIQIQASKVSSPKYWQKKLKTKFEFVTSEMCISVPGSIFGRKQAHKVMSEFTLDCSLWEFFRGQANRSQVEITVILEDTQKKVVRVLDHLNSLKLRENIQEGKKLQRSELKTTEQNGGGKTFEKSVLPSNQ